MYSPVAVESFGGLNLLDDPGTVGWNQAIDLLNVDFDLGGQLRSRDGYTKFNSVTPAARYRALQPFFKSDGTTRQLVCGRSDANIEVLDMSGVQVALTASIPAGSPTEVSFTRLGTPSTEVVYCAQWKYSGTVPTPLAANAVTSWNGSAFTPGAMAYNPCFIATSAIDNRLVMGNISGTTAGSNGSSVRFSDPGAPTTLGVNNFVDLTPGDSEVIRGIVSWRELIFVFKETKFFVFYGTSTDASGNPVFNYRPVDMRTESVAPRTIVATPEGVYFANRRGIYMTTGGQPVRVSDALDPLFIPSVNGSGVFASSIEIDQSLLATECTMTWHYDRLYFAYPRTGSSANDRVLVHEPKRDTWTLYDIPAAGMTPLRVTTGAVNEDLMFSYASGANNIGRHGSAYTTDNGTSITSRYRSGFSDLGTPLRKRVREWILEGSGTPTLKTSFDFGALETGAAVTLGTAPAVAEQRRRYAIRGRQFSFQIGATTAWSLNNLVAHIDERRAPGAHTTE